MRRVDLTGKKYGMLSVVGLAGYWGKQKHSHWVCRCECGRQKDVSICNLSNGNTRSCGCLALERIKTMGQSNRIDPITKKAKRKAYLERRSLESRVYSRRYAKQLQRDLHDSYIKKLVSSGSGIPWAMVPLAVIEARRELIKVKRLIKEMYK